MANNAPSGPNPGLAGDGSPPRETASAAGRRAAAFRATREAHSTEMAEDYVELIGDLIQETGEARLTDLARHMGVTQATAAKVVQRLKGLGLVENRRYRSLFLTDQGRQVAERSRARHQVVVNFLKALGVGADTAEIDAEGLEHHVSEETLRAFERFTQAHGLTAILRACARRPGRHRRP